MTEEKQLPQVSVSRDIIDAVNQNPAVAYVDPVIFATLQRSAKLVSAGDGIPKEFKNNISNCHGALVNDMVMGATTAPDAVRCTKCHSGVGHGPRAGVGAPADY